MTIPRFGAWTILSISVLFTTACATDGGYSTSGSTSGGASGVAAGAVEDTLQACLGRIPSDASAGQRMLAEESCKRDQANRK